MLATVAAVLQPPTDMRVSSTVGWAWTILGIVMVGVTIVMAAVMARRERTWLWLVFVPACGLCLFIEPPADILGATWYATNTPLMLGEIMGRPMPLYVLCMYLAYLPLGFWLCYLILKRGPTSTRTMALMWLAGILANCALEITFTQLDAHRYYGDNPARIFGLPAYSMLQNGALMIFGAALMLWAKERLRGAQVLYLLPIIPGAFFAWLVIQTWPTYVTLNSDTTDLVRYAVAAITVALNFGCGWAGMRSRWLHDLQVRAAAADHGVPRSAATSQSRDSVVPASSAAA